MVLRIWAKELVERLLNSNQVGILMVLQSFVSVAESSFNGNTSETIGKSAKNILTNRTKHNPSENFCITMYVILCMSCKNWFKCLRPYNKQILCHNPKEIRFYKQQAYWYNNRKTQYSEDFFGRWGWVNFQSLDKIESNIALLCVARQY